ncbi:alpha/beta fold hydrolase [Tunturiibacter empetritectus]|uniref:alpha/beta fold hydrolase n=1 Tax=Tunturiibacter empetritectus TaxID=3069691 RepID=UPI003D9ACE2B
MFRYVATILFGILLSAPLVAEITPFPASFHTQMVPTNGTRLYVRVGGKGPAVVLLHGFGFTGDMWAPLAIVLAKDHTVIVPDLRGMGMSDHPDTGYTKKNQAVDIAGVMDALKVQKADLVTHDIGNMIGYALAAQYPVRVTRWVAIDAPLPGIGDWDNIVRSPMLWHFDFRGPDEERLVQGRERIYLDRFWNELSGDPKRIDEDTRQHFAALYARPQAMHDAFEQFGALRQDAADNKALLRQGRQDHHAGVCHRCREVFRQEHGRSYAVRRQQRHGRHRAQLRALDHGGESTGHHQVGYRFPRQVGLGFRQSDPTASTTCSCNPGVTQRCSGSAA